MREPGTLAYRPDIDGLRAVAVGSVVAYHAAPAHVPGGFVGVDVFFVISGFLISSIILTEEDEGRFSLANFYARRIRRLFPALILVLAATAAAGWYYLLAHELEQLGKHIAAGAAYFVNFTLRAESGYFDTEAETKPLLHLWSLAVEEQFYIVWPILLLLIRDRRRLLLALIVITVGSLASNLLTIGRDPAAAFYLPHNRFWELGLGALLAFAYLYAPRGGLAALPPRAATLASLSGMALILGAAFALRPDIPYPGAWALIPCLGAALVIAAGPGALLNRWLLSLAPMVFVGLISYPLYLWHWPLLSFPAVIGALDEPYVRIGAVALAVLLASATYLLVERPLRHVRTIALPAALMAVTVGFCGLGLAAYLGRLSPRLDAPQYADLSAATQDWRYPDGLTRTTVGGMRVYTSGRGADKVLFFGDSNVEQYWPRIEAITRQSPERQTVMFATVGGCPPIPDVEPAGNLHCPGFARKVAELARDPTIRTVVIAAAWRGYFVRSRLSIAGAPAVRLSPGDAAWRKAFEQLAGMLADMRHRGQRVFLVLQIPNGRKPIDWLRRRLDGTAVLDVRDIPRARAEASWRAIREELVAVAAAHGVGIIDPMDWLCDAHSCRSRMPDGRLVHRDAAHLRASYVREHATALDVAIPGAHPSSAAR